MVKKVILALALMSSAGFAGEINSASFLYSKEPIAGVLRDYLEINLKTSGKCTPFPIRTSGKTLKVKILNCPIKRVYNLGQRGDFVKGAELKTQGQDSLLTVALLKPGTLKVEEGKAGIKIKVIEGEAINPPEFNVIKTPYGEQISIELPSTADVSYDRVGNRFFITLKGITLKRESKELPSQLVKNLEVKSIPSGTILTFYLNPEVSVAEASVKNKTLYINLYKSQKALTGSDKELKVALKFTNADVRSVVRAIANIAKINVVFDPEVNGKVNVDFKKPIYWKDALKAVLEPLNLTYIETPEYYRILPKVKVIKEEALEPVRTYTLPLNYTSGDTIIKNLKEIISLGKKGSREKITFNKETNTLILKVTPTHYREIRKLVSKLDKPLKQVLVKAKIVQVSSRVEKNLGFTWFISGYNRLGDSTGSTYVASTYGFNNQNYSPLITPDSYTQLSKLPVMDNTLALGILNKTQTLKVELALKALEIDGDAKTISSPKVLTLDNQEAVIEQGVEIPYTEATVGSGGTTTYNINFKKASLILKAKPHVTKDGKIILDLEVRKDSPNYDYVTRTGSNEPAINTRNVRSKVIITNGSTVVIGGIYEKEKNKSTTGVPVLSRIPLLGWLFKNHSEIVNKSELLIFITPTIVSSEGTEVGGVK